MAVTELPLKREEDDNTDESYKTSKRGSGMTEKSSRWRDVREYITSKEGWVGNYVRCSLLYPNLALRTCARTDITDNALLRTISTSSHQTYGP